jgi:hypothetical protein
MVVIVNKFHTEFVAMFIIYLHTKFHMLNSNASLVLIISQKTKYKFLMPATLSCCIL